MLEQLSRAEQLEQKRSYWKHHIERWRSSGMTQTAYCIEHELKSHLFTYWKKRFVQTDTGITFVPVKIRGAIPALPDRHSHSLRLIVNGDLQIKIQPDFDPGLLRRLIITLRSLP